MRCLLVVWLLFDVCPLLFVGVFVICVLFVVSRLLLVACCLLFVVSWSLFSVCCLLFVEVLCVVCCLLILGC